MADPPAFLPTDIALPYGVGPNGALVSVNLVVSGLACECTCPGCGKPLVAKKGLIIRHHFAHASDEKCATGFESMVHLLAKDIIARERAISVPEVVVTVGMTRRHIRDAAVLPLTNVRLEQWLDGIRPDIIADYNGHQIIIEIAVTHKAEPAKILELERRGAPAVEIDLSEFHRKEITETRLRTAIFEDAPRVWLFNRLAHIALPEVKAEEGDRLEKLRLRQLREAEENVSLAMEWARWEEQEAARRERDERRAAEIEAKNAELFGESKAKVLAMAADAFSDDKALKWTENAAKNFSIFHGGPDGAEYCTGFEVWCDGQLRHQRAAILATETAHRTTRDNVLRAAIAKFKDRAKADLWMTTTHPRLGGRPFDVCIQADGIEKCRSALR